MGETVAVDDPILNMKIITMQFVLYKCVFEAQKLLLLVKLGLIIHRDFFLLFNIYCPPFRIISFQFKPIDFDCGWVESVISANIA